MIQLTEIDSDTQDVRDGKWGEWEDIKREPCHPTLRVGGVSCGPGRKGQKRKCSRSLGGKYCTEAGEEVVDGLQFRTVRCEAETCPGHTDS